MPRRRILLSREESYIQDGLIFQFEGKDCLGKKEWRDRINKILLVSQYTHDYDEYNGILFMPNGSVDVAYKAPAVFEFPWSESTLEIVFKRLGLYADYSNMFYNYNGVESLSPMEYIGQGGINWYTTTNVSTTNRPALDFYSANDVPYTASYQYNNVIVNAEKHGITSKSNFCRPVGGNTMAIGSRVGYPSGRYVGYIYSIRGYSRLLTDEERLYNQQIDNKRFGLGL